MKTTLYYVLVSAGLLLTFGCTTIHED